jgi:hypothetical protein
MKSLPRRGRVATPALAGGAGWGAFMRMPPPARFAGDLRRKRGRYGRLTRYCCRMITVAPTFTRP